MSFEDHLVATTLTAALDRVMENIIDKIAKDGLVALNKILVSSGFPESPNLANYEVAVHVTRGDEVVFEITLEASAVDITDEAPPPEEVVDLAADAKRSYVLNSPFTTKRFVGVARKDARRPPRDARTQLQDRFTRRPAKEGRKGYVKRLYEHEVALHAPRSINVGRSRRIALTFRKTFRQESEEKVTYPSDSRGPIIDDLIAKLMKIITDQAIPEINKIVTRYVNK